MWSINIRSLVQNKFILCREYHIQPSEIDRMLMFEYEYLLEDITDYVKEQEKQRKKDEKENKMNLPNYNSMMSQAQASVPKVSVPRL
jgi:hypothetical protein